MPTELKEKYPFSVDSWTVLSRRKQHHFLTHAHSDHTNGIESFAGRSIYCSDTTRRLVLRRFPKLEASQFIILDIGEAKLVSNDEHPFSITTFDANHCPGAVMLLFEGQFGNVLHTGDCRLTEECLSNILGKYKVQQHVLDCIFLDCTFGRELLKMPSKREAFLQVQQCILNHPQAPVVYLACDLLGQEDLLSDIVKYFRTKIFVDKDSLPDYYADMNIVAPDLLTEDPKSTRFHICEGFPKLYERAKIKFLQAHKMRSPDPLFIRPSAQWYTYEQRLEGAGCGMILDVAFKRPAHLHRPLPTPKVAIKDQYGIWHVCYSIHSCRSELERAMEVLWPKEVISTTPNCPASEVLSKRAVLQCTDVSVVTIKQLSKGSHQETGSRRDAPGKRELKLNSSAVLSSPPSPKDRKKACLNQSLEMNYYSDVLTNVVPLFGTARYSLPASPPLSFASTDSQTDQDFIDSQSSVEYFPDACEESQMACLPGSSPTLPDCDTIAISVKSIKTSSERIQTSTETQNSPNTRIWKLMSQVDGEESKTNNLDDKENVDKLMILSDNILVSSKENSHIQRLPLYRSNFEESARKMYRSFHVPIPSPLPSLLDLYGSP